MGLKLTFWQKQMRVLFMRFQIVCTVFLRLMEAGICSGVIFGITGIIGFYTSKAKPNGYL